MNAIIGLAVIIVFLALLKTFFDIFVFREPGKASSISSLVDNVRSAYRKPQQDIGKQGLRHLEHRMLQLVNAERKKHSLEAKFARPLEWHESAAEVARAYSLDMARQNFVGHVSPEGVDLNARLRAGGVGFSLAGENVARGYASVEKTMAAFMKEPRFRQNHRSNILNPLFTHVSIGIVLDPNRGLIVTQNFLSL